MQASRPALSFSHVLVVLCCVWCGTHDEMRTFFMFFWAMTRKSTDEKGTGGPTRSISYVEPAIHQSLKRFIVSLKMRGSV